MFNFTTQTIVNSLEGKLHIGNGTNPQVRVGNLRFNTPDVESIEKKLPSEEVLGHVTFELDSSKVTPVNASFTEGKTVSARVAFYVGLAQTSVDSFYANALVYKGKPLYVEFPWTLGDEEKAASDLVKIAKKVLVMDTPILNASVAEDGSDASGSDEGASVTFTCTNGYQIIREAKLQVYDPAANTIDCCNNEGGFVTIVEAVPGFSAEMFVIDGAVLKANDAAEMVDADGNAITNAPVIYPGAEAFADYNWIMHNLRIPTSANTSYWSPMKQMDELPVLGGKYIQYTIKVSAPRDNIGGMVVGERCTSVTTHVLYVKNDVDVTDLETALQATGVSIDTTADDKLTGGGSSAS